MTTPHRPLAAATLVAVAIASIFVPARSAPAQVSEYFVMAGDQGMFHVIQGGVLLRSWTPAPGTAQYQYPIVVTGTISTMGANIGEIGAEYDRNGVDLTLRYTHPAGPGRCWDGTTDGTFNYAIDTAGGVYRFDRSWNNPTLLFSAGGIGSLTYDPTNNSLWVSQFSTNAIRDFAMSGTVLSSFTTAHTQNMALALDHADGTLWLHDRTTQGTFEQYTKSGMMLQRLAVTGMSTQNALGGEMPFTTIARCSFRNGTGINPPDYSCVTRPVIGANWTTSFNVNASTTATALLLGFAPATGPGIWQGELLVSLAPAPIAFAGSGNITLPIPNDPALVSVFAPTQGFRLDGGVGGPQFLLLNAQDIQLGY